MPDLTPDSFMASQQDGTPQLTPDSFMASESTTPKSAQTPASNDTGPSMRAESPTLLDHVRRFLFGGPESETALGRAFPSMSGAKISDTPTSELPLVSIGDLAPRGDGALKNAARGAGDALSGLTTGKNLAILAGTQGLGTVGEAAGVVGKALNAGMAAYFTYEMGKGAGQNVKQAYEQYKAGDYDGMAKSLGYASVDGILGALAATHTEASGKRAIQQFADNLDAHNVRAADLVQQDATQGQGADLGQNIVGPAPIKVKAGDGTEYDLVADGASRKGRPNYAVQDATGKKVFGGNARAVQEWLGTKGAQPNTPNPLAGLDTEAAQSTTKAAPPAAPVSIIPNLDGSYTVRDLGKGENVFSGSLADAKKVAEGSGATVGQDAPPIWQPITPDEAAPAEAPPAVAETPAAPSPVAATEPAPELTQPGVGGTVPSPATPPPGGAAIGTPEPAPVPPPGAPGGSAIESPVPEPEPAPQIPDGYEPVIPAGYEPVQAEVPAGYDVESTPAPAHPEGEVIRSNTNKSEVEPAPALTPDSFMQAQEAAPDEEPQPNPHALTYQKGHNKIGIYPFENGQGRWHHNSDYNLQGLMGGSGGSPTEGFASKDEAVQDAVKDLQRRLQPVADGKSGSSAKPAHIREAKRMLSWLDGLTPEPEPKTESETETKPNPNQNPEPENVVSEPELNPDSFMEAQEPAPYTGPDRRSAGRSTALTHPDAIPSRTDEDNALTAEKNHPDEDEAFEQARTQAEESAADFARFDRIAHDQAQPTANRAIAEMGAADARKVLAKTFSSGGDLHSTVGGMVRNRLADQYGLDWLPKVPKLDQYGDPIEEPEKPATIEPDESGRSNPEALEAEPSRDGEGADEAGQAGGSSEFSGGSSRGDVQPSESEGSKPGSSGRAGATTLDESGERTPDVSNPGDLTRQTVGNDFRITEDDHIGEGTERQKLNANLAAVRIAKAVAAENRLATREEQAKLARYVGWGGLSGVFDTGKREYSGAREELQSLLTTKEYEAARKSTLNAHYTSPTVVNSMWEAMQHLGLQDGASILEPSMGIGNFFGLQPDATLPARRTGVELDAISGLIARALYPDSNVQIAGFQELALPNDFFDVAISNVPFGNYGVHDPKYKKHPAATKSIHNYFFVKSLDLVRPGGVVAFVTSRYTMDAKSKVLRQMLAQKANLLGMFRLPNTAFKGNAGTEVVTDVILLQKRAPGELRSGPEWIDTTEVATADGGKTKINQYYADHPEMILGRLDLTAKMYTADEDADRQNVTGKLTPEMLTAAVKRLPAGVFTRWEAQTPAFEGTAIVLGDKVKDGGYSIRDGVVVQREGSLSRPVQLGKTQEARVRGMIPVRDALYEVYRTQYQQEAEAAIKAARDVLNTTYDSFVKKFGPISNTANARAYGGDPDYLSLSALETDFDKDTQTAAKMPVFSQRTIEIPTPAERADTAAEALALTLNERGRIDWDRMQQLTGKTPDEMREEMAGLVFKNPNGQKWEAAEEYLSGRVRDKLAIAQEAAKADPVYQTNVEALEKVQPPKLGPAEIKITLGAGWIPSAVVKQFVREHLDISDVDVSYSPEVGAWNLTSSKQEDRVKNQQAGTARWNGLDLLDKALNGKKPKALDRDGGVIKDETVAGNAALEALKDAFRQWIWQDKDRADKVSHIYNQEINNLRGTEFDGSHLTMPGSNPAIKLRPHQKNAIWRIIRKGNALLAHEVGAGKTWEMVGAAMELRRLGLAKKPMLVVPNHMLEQFTTEFYQLYPAARLLTIGRDELQQDKRKRAMARIANGVWDAVIVAHSSFGKIPVSDETFQKHVEEQLAELRTALEAAQSAARNAKERKGDHTVKEIEKAIERLETRLQKRLNREVKDDGVTFEQLGVDALFVDEAHAYKKLAIATQRTRVAGIPTGDSQRAADMFMKTNYVMGLNGGSRGVTFATGTPITNTMAELYNMQKYLQPDTLKAAGVYNFDAWANTFGDIQTGYELDVSGKGFRENERFAKFLNIPELLRMFQQVADIKTGAQLKLPRPSLVSGAMQPITGASSPELKRFIDYLVKRSEAIRNKKVEPDEDNMLKVVSEGRKAALDIRMVMPHAPDYPDSKINKAVANVLKFWQDGVKDKTTQIVFCDLSVPASAKKGAKKNKAIAPPEQPVGDDESASAEDENDTLAVPEAAGELAGFSAYDDMRAKLIRAGVPESEIAFIHDFNGDVAKQNLFNNVNAGKVRIIFGSTEKMGVGTNIQKRAIALHHLDTPWRPGDVTQRNGRIERQGNMHDAVHIFQYLTEGSFDAYMWQLVESKAQFIQAVMTGDLTMREMEDIGMMIPNADEFKALATGDPMVKEKIMVDGQLGKLEAQRSAFFNKRSAAQWQNARLPESIKYSKQSIAAIQSDVATINGHEGWTIGNVRFGKDERKEAADAIHAALNQHRGDKPRKEIGTYRGIPFHTWQYINTKGEYSGSEDTYPNLRFDGKYLSSDIANKQEDPMAAIRSMEASTRNFLNGDALARFEGELAEQEKRYAEIHTIINAKWPLEDRYQGLIRKQAELAAHFAAGPGEATLTLPPFTLPADAEEERYVSRDEGEGSDESRNFRPLVLRSEGESPVSRPTAPLTEAQLFEDELRRDHGLPPKHTKKPESSGVVLGSGLGALQPYFDKFLAEDVVPTAKQLGELVKLGKDDVLKWVAPAARGPEAETAALSVRKNAAQLARSKAVAAASLKVAGKFFDAQPAHANYDFIDRIETGQKQPDKNLQQIADIMRDMLDDRRDAIQALGTGKLSTFIEDYFPHVWKHPKQARQSIINHTKAPMEGSKGFLKKRTIDTFTDGLAVGLEPISDNPVDMVLAKAQEMDKFLSAHLILKDLKAAGLLQFRRATQPMPEGYRKIEDRVATVWGAPSHPGAIQMEGEWVTPEPAARVLNNYLSPGLRDKSALYRAYLGFGNLVNQAQLSLSAFHLGFTTVDAATSKLALGIYQLGHGDIVKGLKSAAVGLSPASPFLNVMRGDKLLKEYYAPGTQGALIGELVDAMVRAGGRAQMDEFYQTRVSKQLMKAWRSGNVFGALFRAPLAALEQTARPIMDYVVPRQKLGVFADLAQYELERLGTNATDPDVQAALARAWDSVDNRLGQLVYDNLFWHKVVKDLAMGSVRSVGWNVGTIREVAGGIGDTGKFLKDAVSGGGPDFTPRMSYIVALPLMAGLLGATLYYLWHGKAPEKLKDYYFPTDAKGHRWNLWTYVKDIYEWGTDPVRTAEGKIHPALSMTFEMLSNREFFDKPIRNPHHRLVKQAEELANFAVKQFVPMAYRDRPHHHADAEERALGFVGIRPAPKSLDKH